MALFMLGPPEPTNGMHQMSLHCPTHVSVSIPVPVRREVGHGEMVFVATYVEVAVV